MRKKSVLPAYMQLLHWSFCTFSSLFFSFSSRFAQCQHSTIYQSQHFGTATVQKHFVNDNKLVDLSKCGKRGASSWPRRQRLAEPHSTASHVARRVYWRRLWLAKILGSPLRNSLVQSRHAIGCRVKWQPEPNENLKTAISMHPFWCGLKCQGM